MDVVDAHMHLWDTERFTYPWFAGDPRLDRTFAPADYREQVPEPTSLVFVEAACLPEQGPAEVAHRGLTFDVSGHWDQLDVFAQAVSSVPDLVVVLDHVGKPPVAQGWASPEREGWSHGLHALAARENAVIKLSGLVPETPAHLDLEAAVRPFVQHALDVFGPRRCLLGSDWPMSTSAPGPRGILAWQHLVLEASGLDLAERMTVAAGAARATYRLDTPTPTGPTPSGPSSSPA